MFNQVEFLRKLSCDLLDKNNPLSVCLNDLISKLDEVDCKIENHNSSYGSGILDNCTLKNLELERAQIWDSIYLVGLFVSAQFSMEPVSEKLDSLIEGLKCLGSEEEDFWWKVY